ncbi:TM1812 family CRISPR-associated protein [Fervidobacterium sp. 2310opik-2]|uniref:CRISPR-associated DxTHG motif protein n=1 Tax=Fervidobacterium sp. 2310opik-2 TaxID=1755815 RepID=UPI0013E05D14|nr:TM1812 family CRISPR-associated protein [Fervidobacterium sp. 2310opik-2]KAF2961067.1 hypothetical protein AS161_03570 [Fervidobacterium sp. 2310opik-2]
MGTAIITFLEDESFKTQCFKYKFSDDSVLCGQLFGKVLYDYLSSKNIEITKMVLLGMANSNFEMLVDIFPEEYRENYLKFLDKVRDYDIKEKKRIMEKLVAKLKEFLNYDVELIIIDSTDNFSRLQKEIGKAVMKSVAHGINRVYLDITHGIRFIPFLALGILLPARYVEIEKISIFYGYRESHNDLKPALELNGLEEMISFDENMAIFKFSGDFYKPASKIFKQKADKIRKAYVSFELNNVDIDLFKEISQIGQDLYFFRPIRNELYKVAKCNYLDEIYMEKAEFYFEREQYFKAIPLVFEAILVVTIRKFFGKKNFSQSYKEKAKRFVNKILDKPDSQVFITLWRLRNAIVHGPEKSNGKGSSLIKKFEDEEKLKILFSQAKDIYEKIKNYEENFLFNLKTAV